MYEWKVCIWHVVFAMTDNRISVKCRTQSDRKQKVWFVLFTNHKIWFTLLRCLYVPHLLQGALICFTRSYSLYHCGLIWFWIHDWIQLHWAFKCRFFLAEKQIIKVKIPLFYVFVPPTNFQKQAGRGTWLIYPPPPYSLFPPNFSSKSAKNCVFCSKNLI